jgi:methylmalonyl-CoA/ethylmalonyl-CoA epimerase
VKLHHVGYAVASIQDYFTSFLAPLVGATELGPVHEDPVQGVRVAFVEVSPGALVELVEPLHESNPVRQFIGSPRGGLYHLCYEVDDLEATIARFRRKRCLPLAAAVPAVAFDGRRIVFMMTPQRDLVELVEAKTPQIEEDP